MFVERITINAIRRLLSCQNKNGSRPGILALSLRYLNCKLEAVTLGRRAAATYDHGPWDVRPDERSGLELERCGWTISSWKLHRCSFENAATDRE